MLANRLARLCLIQNLVQNLVLTLTLLGAARPALAADDAGDALRRAATAGDLAKVRELIAAGTDVNAANAYGGTALAFACDHGRKEVVDFLLASGADVNAKDTYYGATPLSWAVERGHAEIVRALLTKGATGEADALVSAAGNGNAATVKVILERKTLGPEPLSDALVAARKAEQGEVAALLEAAGAKPPVLVAVDPAVLASYAGSYDSEELKLAVVVKDGKLVATTPSGFSLTFAAVDTVTFKAEEMPGLKIAFQVEGGKVTGLLAHQGEETTPLKRKDTP
jgi:ankyrin repeat protein